jgi:hypothetical protein
MKKYTLKYVVALSFLTFVPVSQLRTENQVEKEHVDFIHELLKNTADFIQFSSAWTEDFFDTKNAQTFATFAQQMTDATTKFNTIVIKPLNENINRLPKNSHYHEALRIGKEIVCTLYNQAHHISSILNKNLNSRSVIKVGMALDDASQYIKTKMIHELEEKFNRFENALKKVDPALAAHVRTMGRTVIEARKYQHDMTKIEKMRALGHRLKC